MQLQANEGAQRQLPDTTTVQTVALSTTCLEGQESSQIVQRLPSIAGRIDFIKGFVACLRLMIV